MLRTHSLQKLNMLQQALLGYGGLDEKFKKITDNVVAIFNADFCRIWIKGPGDICEKSCVHVNAKKPEKLCRKREHCLHLIASSGRYTHIDGPHRRVPFGLYKIGRVADGQTSKFLTNDVVNDPQIGDHEWARGLGLVSFAGYKLQDTNGEPIGVLALFSKHPITPEEDAMLEGIAGITAHVIQTAKAERMLKVSEQKLSIQYSVVSVLAESAALKEATPKVIEAICESTGWDMGAIWIVDHQAGVLRCIEHWHRPSIDFSEFEAITRQYTFSRGVGLPGRVWEKGKPEWIIDVTKDTNFPRAHYATNVGLNSAFGFPIRLGGETIGVMEFFSREIRQPDEGLLQMFNAIGSQIGQFMERKRIEEQNSHLAYYDILTELPNRLSLHDDIDRAISHARKELVPFALLIINLDRFEEINNTMGHPNGDIILQQIAIRLKGICGEPNRVARMGGDIFAAILQKTDAEAAAKRAVEIIGVIKAPLSIADLSLEVSASIGIALFPGHGTDADTLIRRAEITMYVAKKIESSICTYVPQYDQYSQKRLALMGELRHAIEQEQLFLLYQPKVDLKTGKTIGVEALCRWQHPKSGVIPPNDFICLAERGGLIKELTLWVIKESMRQLRNWHKRGFEVAVAMNLSVRNLQNPQLLDKIKGLISTWGISPGAMRFEITESIIMQNPELAMETITELTSMGIKFSIDDFGTGYSSLSYLQRLPVDEIKIDKSFVINMETDKNNAMIVRSVIEMAHNLGMKVTAEGVENKEVMDKLISLGCDDAQGYYISKPITHEELVSWMGKQ